MEYLSSCLMACSIGLIGYWMAILTNTIDIRPAFNQFNKAKLSVWLYISLVEILLLRQIIDSVYSLACTLILQTIFVIYCLKNERDVTLDWYVNWLQALILMFKTYILWEVNIAYKSWIISIQVVVLAFNLTSCYLKSKEGNSSNTFASFFKLLILVLPYYLPIKDKRLMICLIGSISMIVFGRVLNYYQPLYMKYTVAWIENLASKNTIKAQSDNFNYNDIQLQEGAKVLIPYLIMTLVIDMDIISFLRKLLFQQIQAHVSNSLSKKLLEHIFSLSYQEHITSSSGEWTNTLQNSVNRIEEAFTYLFVVAVPQVLDSFISLGILSSAFGGKYLVVLSFGAISYICLNQFFISWSNNFLRKSIQIKDQIQSHIIDCLRQIQVIKLYTNETHELNKYEEALASKSQFDFIKERVDSTSSFARGLSKGLAFSICIIWCVYEIYLGSKKPSDFAYFKSRFELVFRPLRVFTIIYNYLRSSLVEGEKILLILEKIAPNNLATIDESGREIDQVCDITGTVPAMIEFKNIKFNYPSKKPIFDNLSFTIQPGSIIGLVGSSGSGKSTIIKLITRLYDVNSGDILMNGKSIYSMDRHKLRKDITVIPQTLTLFNLTIKENIIYSSFNISIEQLHEAAKKALIHDKIMSLPNQYDTLVGGAGLSLSGGEIQRIALARAFLKNTPLVVLDEATSALDNLTTSNLIKAIANLQREGKTVIMVAHRLSTITDADLIFCMDEGKIIEAGNHKALLKKNGIYARMWETEKV